MFLQGRCFSANQAMGANRVLCRHALPLISHRPCSRVALSDLLMRNFITPAIINPQASGVVSDTPISPTAE